jgi:hypothetical protein
VFTARYALSPYIKQIRFAFKGRTLNLVCTLARLLAIRSLFLIFLFFHGMCTVCLLLIWFLIHLHSIKRHGLYSCASKFSRNLWRTSHAIKQKIVSFLTRKLNNWIQVLDQVSLRITYAILYFMVWFKGVLWVQMWCRALTLTKKPHIVLHFWVSLGTCIFCHEKKIMKLVSENVPSCYVIKIIKRFPLINIKYFFNSVSSRVLLWYPFRY